jgi:hypothetical protein
MAALSNYLESGLLSQIFRAQTAPQPATIYVALIGYFNSSDLESGSLANELTDLSRKSLAASTDNWAAPYASGTAMATHNNYEIRFDQATSNIGYASGVALIDAGTGGNILMYGQLTNPKEIRDGDQFVFSSGALKITFN